MDIIDNIVHAARINSGGNSIQSDFAFEMNVGEPTNINLNGTYPQYEYSASDKFVFCAHEDPSVIEKATQRHWYDISHRIVYGEGGIIPTPVPSDKVFSNFQLSPGYHMVYAYVLENTRIVQIFERLITKYMLDEEMGIASDPVVFNWIMNCERLFFKCDTERISNLRSQLRPSSDSSRRNAYMRMLGMDLAFGEPNDNTAPVYHKAKASNVNFVPIFETYLTEIWQGYLNARNTAGPNKTDVNAIVQLTLQLKEMLQARRGGSLVFKPYANLNLSREEYSSVLLTSWFRFIISYDSPVVNYLSCQSSTIGERLLKLGMKAGIPSHTKSQSLFELAGPLAAVMNAVESTEFLADPTWIQAMLSSLDPTKPASEHSAFMNQFLTVINNWEKSTGHAIKTVVSVNLNKHESNGAVVKQLEYA
jgi:hypothetical protein